MRSLTLFTCSVLCLVHESLQALPSCDFTLYPDSGCASQLMTSCQVSNNKCVCRTGYPIEVNGRCFEYKSVGKECITSSQCFKAKCVDAKNGEEIISEQGVEANRKGMCTCTEDRFFDPIRKECSQRFIHKRCNFYSGPEDCGRTYAYCDRGKCTCRPGFVYELISDHCIPTPMPPPCYSGFITVTENGTTRCRHRGDAGGYYPYFRRPSYANFMWPVFAFFLVLLMFKLLKEGIERECPNVPGGSSPFVDHPSSSHSSRRPSTRFNLMLPVTRAQGHRVSISGGNRSQQGTQQPHGTGSTARSPSLDTIISLPPPYDSQTMAPRTTATTTIPHDSPPSYEEATRKE